MVQDKKKVESEKASTKATDFLKSLREFAITVGEECPEGHRRDPASGACLPIGSTDHTAFTRSVNDDQGDFWRGIRDKENKTFDSDGAASDKETALDAEEMDEPQSCPEGSTFSFLKRECVSLEEAEQENNDELAMEEVAVHGHEDVVALQPEGRRDTVNHACPPNQFFDYILRECIPLNKDTIMASEKLDDEFKRLVAMSLSGRLAVTSPDPLDGHRHLVTVDEEGNGMTSVSASYMDGNSYYHSHTVAGYVVEDHSEDGYTSKHFGHVIPKEMWEYRDHDDYPAPSVGSEEWTDAKEMAAPLKGGQRRALPDSAFGVPGKRKFPLDTCGRVRNAMARFNQAKGLTSSEKATLRRKILARAKACGVEVRNFAKASSEEEFSQVMKELMLEARVTKRYTAAKDNTGPCPPGMVWNASSKQCGKTRGFIQAILEQADHSEIISKDPAGRKDTVNFQCPDGWIFDFGNRKCIPLDPSMKEGFQPGDTTKAAEEDSAQRDLSPSPAGKPAKLPQDCPEGTIWQPEQEKCLPLDSRKKTKSAEDEEGQTNSNGPGKDKDSKGCGPGEFLNPITKKCMPRKGAFKGKSDKEDAQAMPGNREGLTPAPAGKVQHQSDCPPNTAWDAKMKICRPIDSMDKNRPSGASPQSPKSTADVSEMSSSLLIKHLDAFIKEEIEAGRKEKARVSAKDLPNEAFPPSLVSSIRRALMHHDPSVEDAYDHESVDASRLRNALARVDGLTGYAAKAVDDAREHLIFHAREIVSNYLSKKD
jgi:hypothetical protein